MGAPVTGTHKVIEYAHKLYQAMLDKSTVEVFETTTGETASKNVYRGKYSHLFLSIGASQTYYTKIRKVLNEHECITVVERGTRNSESVIILNHPPPDHAEVPVGGLTAAGGFATLAKRVEVLENWRASHGGISIVQALRNMELRLAKLESQTGGRRENGKNEESQDE